MLQLQATRHGEPADVLRVAKADDPPLGPRQVRLSCAAVGLNFLDVMLCRGTYPVRPEPPYTPGVEVAGTVVEAGPDTADLLGAPVLACPTLPHGALGERVVVDAELVVRRPPDLPAVPAAALPVTYQTAWFALQRAGLRAGETVLVLGGAGGVGVATTQLAVARGATVIAAAGGPAKCAVCRAQGAALAIDYLAADVGAAVADATGGAGVDVVVDPVGGPGMGERLGCLGFEGRYVVVGVAGGPPPPLDPLALVPANATLVGLSWGSAYPWRRPAAVAAAYDELFGLYARGDVAPLISAEVPLAAVPAALGDLAARRTVGKLVAVPAAGGDGGHRPGPEGAPP